MLVRKFLEKYPDSAVHMMTPGGFVDLTPEQAKALLSGEGVKAHPGVAGCDLEVKLEAEELLNEKVHSVNWKNGAYYLMTNLASREEQEEPQGLRELEESMENGRKLKERLKANYEAYIQQMRQKPAEEIIGMAEEIAATKLVYEELSVEGAFGEYAGYLLQFENPLEVLRDNWQDCGEYERYEKIDHMLWNMKDKGIGIGDYPKAEQAGEGAQSQGVVMC